MIKILDENKQKELKKIHQKYERSVIDFLVGKKNKIIVDNVYDALGIFYEKNKLNHSRNIKYALKELTKKANVSIILDEPSSVVEYVESLDKIHREAIKGLFKIINWSNFRQNNLEIIYNIVDILNIKVCPYCGRHMIDNVTFDSRNKRIVPDIDHFYSETDYPYLKLSLYNLIPSCNICNSRLKRQHDQKESPIVYPYKEGYDGYVNFNISNSKNITKEEFEENIIRFITGDRFNTKIKPENIEFFFANTGIKDDEMNDKINQSNTIFYILDFYNKAHKQVAIETLSFLNFLRKNNLVSYAYNSLQDPKLVLQLSPNDVNFMKCLCPSNDLLEPLSKFKRDIFNQFGGLAIRKNLLSKDIINDDTDSHV